MDKDEDVNLLLQRYPNPLAGEQFNPNSDEICHLFDESTCHLFDDSTLAGMAIDSIGRLPDNNMKPQLKHVTNHAIRGDVSTRFQSGDNETHFNQNYDFNVQEFVTRLDQAPQMRAGLRNYDYLVQNYGLHLQQMNYGATRRSAVDNFFIDCQGKPCLVGPAYLTGKVLDANNPDNAAGPPLVYSPHVTLSKSTSTRVYVSASLPDSLIRHRTKQGWEIHYGWGREHGKRCTVCIIDPKFWPLIERVGCANGVGDQNDLGSTLLPLQIRTIYEVTWNSAALHDSDWRKIFENGSWTPHANTHVSGFNAANAAH